VAWVANYRPWKQAEIFVRLAGRLSHLDCRFILVLGKTKEEYIRSVIRQAQAEKTLILSGELSNQEVENLLEKASLFVNTSLGHEGFPNTFVQSWLRETPVVSLNVNPGGVLTREKIGMCSGSFEQLALDTAKLLENDGERKDMGTRARRYAENAHGLEHNAKKIAKIFSCLAAAKEASF
jgi:glycosyltransferase involved in cell wall biosynthesis